jgi:hypothetical protein
LQNCDGFPDQCGDSCTNTNTDPLNCGDCGEACNADELCSDGNCEEYVPAECDSCPCDSCDGELGNCCEIDGYGPVCIDGDC